MTEVEALATSLVELATKAQEGADRARTGRAFTEAAYYRGLRDAYQTAAMLVESRFEPGSVGPV